MNSINRIFDIPYWQNDKFSMNESLVAREGETWKAYSSSELLRTAEKFAMGLLSLGLGPGDAAAIISANRPEWNMADFGMQMAGVINVPLYTTLSESEIIFILNDCKAKYIFC